MSLKTDIFCIQEHFLLRANVFKIQNEFNDFNSVILPATKDNNIMSKGRPSGGLAIFWKNSLNKYVKPINIPNSTRTQAITLNNNLIIINSYFPCDTQDENFNEFELIKCLEEISGIITAHPNHEILIAGDLNTDFGRDSPFVSLVRDFMMNLNLSAAWWLNPVDFTFSFTRNNRTSFSTLDHFLLCDYLQSHIKDSSVIHLGDNLSGHDPIYISVEPRVAPALHNSSTIKDNDFINKPSWDKATDEQKKIYIENLQHELTSIDITQGLLCNDVKCNSDAHKRQIDAYCKSLLDVIDMTTSSTIPPVSRPTEKKLPGWLDAVKPYQDEARFYHAIWVSYGEPRDCPLHDSMKHTRNAYHYAVRRAKRNEEQIKNKHLLDHCLKGKSTDVIKEFKKQNHSNQQKSSVIDGHSSDQNIANRFGEIYTELYQRNSSSEALNTQMNDLNSKIDADNFREVERITPGVVYQAIQTLKSCKNDNSYCFKSDAMIIGKDVLTNYLTVLFQACIIHGYMPNSILTATLKPIVKDKLGDKCSSSNYRAIGGSSLILKLLDIIILILFESSFKLCENQFGFQKNSSTTLCSWTVKETINYFLNRDTPIYTCFLDMTKAFDLVNYAKLFDKLKDRLSPLFLRLLAFIYSMQKCDVLWNNSRSKSFNVLNGVRQGAILSPILFSIYVDDLFMILKNSGFGCFINNHYYGAVSYADDIVLMCPSVAGLQQMINITNEFFVNLNLIISLNTVNPSKSKTKCMAFGINRNPNQLKIKNDIIPWTDSYTHLGHVLYRDGNMERDCISKKRSFIGRYHSLCQLLKQKHPSVYMKLIGIYLCDFYGSNLWDLFGDAVDNLYIAWNQMIRFVFGLPCNSHRYLIAPISDTSHLKTKLTDRFIKFHEMVKCNDKPIVQNLFKFQAKDVRSVFGKNVFNICNSSQKVSLESVSRGDVKYHPISNDDSWKLPLIKELILLKFNVLEVDFDPDFITQILNFTSTS